MSAPVEPRVSLAKKDDDFWHLIAANEMLRDFPPAPPTMGFRFMLNAIPDYMPVLAKTVTYFGGVENPVF